MRRRPAAVVAAERWDARTQDAWWSCAQALAPYGVQGPRWPGLVWNYESAGLDHTIVNDLEYSGLWQRGRYAPGRPYVDAPGKLDPAVQIADYTQFCLDQIAAFKIEWFPTLGDFYCLNLAPAKVRSRVVYAGPGPWLDELGVPADGILAAECAAEFKKRPTQYAAQDRSLDPPVGPDGRRKGWLAAADFGAVLLHAETPRLRAELAALRTRHPF